MFRVANLSWELVISQLILGPASGKKLQRLREAQYLADGGRATFLSAFWESQTALASSLSSVGASPELRQHSGSVIFVWHWKDLQKVIKQQSVLRNPTVYSKVRQNLTHFQLRKLWVMENFSYQLGICLLINLTWFCSRDFETSMTSIWCQIPYFDEEFYKFDFSRQNGKVSFNFT